MTGLSKDLINSEKLQKDVLTYLALGDTYSEICNKTGLTKYSLQNCLSFLKKKFKVPNRVALAYQAARTGFIK